MLRSSTISQFQRGINVQRLPQVFQDAIDLTRQLGVDYLWIDSLCIIQDEDDHSDWDRECLTMDKVYSHAFLNISATLSQSGTESLFHPRHSQAPSLPPRIDINAHGNMKQYVLDSNFWHNEISDGPLNSRGWVFQERFLACRVLHFGQRQIGWECQVSEAIEAFPDGLPPSLTVGSRSKPGNHEALREASQTILSQAQIVQNELLMSSPAADIRFAEWWNCLIEDYSRCKFTFTKDKLIALSGVAKCVAKSRPADRYLAGMWQSCMVYGLAWFRIHDPERVYSNTGSFEFPSPSWSWASFDGEVCFPPIGPGNPECFAKVVRIAEDPMLLEGAVYANANISPHAYSSIKIESFLFPLHVHWSEKSIDNVMLVDFGLCFSVNDELFGAGIDLEEDEMLKSMTCRDPLFLVPLYATIYFLQAMILVGAEGQGNVYRRLGMIEIPIQMQDAKNEEADQIRLNWNALHLKQHMKKHEKGVEKNSRYSAFEIL